ncbi:hypothetical protein ACFWF3_34810 [Nocardia sp. NPDC060220]
MIAPRVACAARPDIGDSAADIATSGAVRYFADATTPSYVRGRTR